VRRNCPGRADSTSDRLENDYILKSDDRSIGRIWHHHQDAALAHLPPSARPPAHVSNGSGLSVPLGDLADISWEPGPAQIEREQGKRVITVQANVRAAARQHRRQAPR
jgi:hypothetical protein